MPRLAAWIPELVAALPVQWKDSEGVALPSPLSIRNAGFTGSGSTGGGAVELELAELDPADLPGQGLRQVADELDPARVGIGGETLADERLDLVRQRVRRVVPLGEDDERLDDVPAELVR